MFGYAWSQLQRALSTADASADTDAQARAGQRASSWAQVLSGMLSGRVRVGTRSPVQGFPMWLTPEIVRGGYATGAAAAGQGLDPDEYAILAAWPHVQANRASLFAWFLSDEGLSRLNAWLDSGRYRTALPEHGALLSVAYLLRTGHVDAANDMLALLEPWGGSIRFWPFDSTECDTPGVHVATVPEVSERLRRKRPQNQLEKEREALTVWAPFTDRVVAHWWLTRTPGQGVDSTRPAGWDEGAQALLLEYEQVASAYTLTRKHADPKGTLQQLLTGFEKRLADPDGPPMGKVRHAVACAVAKRGEPGSAGLTALREGQARRVAGPSHSMLAHEAASMLRELGIPGGAVEPEALLAGTPALNVPGIRRTLSQATHAPLADLLRLGVVRSAEMVAVLAPQLTSETVASRYKDPVAGTLAKRVYQSFANRRSVLLLNHESQVTVDSIPWFKALEPTAPAIRNQGLAHAQAADMATLALRSFPGTILPNSLVRELVRLYALAKEDAPLTYELAADIFTGTFSPLFQRAAQEAATILAGTLYARYYAIDYTTIFEMTVREEDRTEHLRASVPEFDALAWRRAGSEPTGWARSTAQGGRVIEQAQILTTHNLAALTKRGADLDPTTQAEGAWKATRLHLAKWLSGDGLRHRKNAAYAWRQTLYYLSLASSRSIAAFIDNRNELDASASPSRDLEAAVLQGLIDVVNGGQPRSGPFLGWFTPKG